MVGFRQGIEAAVPALRRYARALTRNVELADDVFDRPWAGKVLASIDGKRSLDEIEQVSYVNRFEVHKMVALLVEGGAVAPLPAEQLRSEADAAAAAGDHEATVKYLTRLAARGAASPEVHRRLVLRHPDPYLRFSFDDLGSYLSRGVAPVVMYFVMMMAIGLFSLLAVIAAFGGAAALGHASGADEGLVALVVFGVGFLVAVPFFVLWMALTNAATTRAELTGDLS